mgnify:CR=1 FL=1
MTDYKFKLTPAYCLYNGVAVLEQRGAEIRFLIENEKDLILRQRLINAFEGFLEIAIKHEDCPEIYRRLPSVVFEHGSRKTLRKLVSNLYQSDSFVENTESRDGGDTAENEAAAVLLLDKLLEEGRLKNATDIHIENNVVRYRSFGRIEKAMELIPERAQELVQRIKLLSGMNVLERSKSQDGHFIYGRNAPIFVRASTMSVISKSMESSESVVLRLLDTSRIPLYVEKLGFNQSQLEKIEMLCNLKNGLVLVAGPTGSGKSTTAASILMEIVRVKGGGVKIVSLEDPPEYVIPGVCQLQIDERSGEDFGSALKHVFRQDPDVIMIGEIRDSNTASTAIRAALTGHLVFGTVHASSAGSSFLRLTNLGVEANVLSSVLRGVICQELEYERDSREVNLLADIAVPSFDFSILAGMAYTEKKLEELFNHYENYGDAISRSVEKMKKRVLPIINLKKSEERGESYV